MTFISHILPLKNREIHWSWASSSSIKVLFKTNTKGHKHPSIRLLSKSKTQLVNQGKQKVAFSPGTTHSSEIQSYRTWWDAASPILNDIPVVYIYTSYNITHIRNAYIYISTQSFWMGSKVIWRKHIIQPTGFGACSSTCCQWDGEDVPAPWERSNSHPPVRVQKSCVNQLTSINIVSVGSGKVCYPMPPRHQAFT